MSEEEYAWVVGCSVEELSPTPTMSEDLSNNCIDIELLKQTDAPKPSATDTVDEGDKGMVLTEANGMLRFF